MTPLVDRRPPDYDELLRLAEAAPFNAADVPTFPPAADFLRAASPVVVAALIRENRQQAERIAALKEAAKELLPPAYAWWDLRKGADVADRFERRMLAAIADEKVAESRP